MTQNDNAAINTYLVNVRDAFAKAAELETGADRRFFRYAHRVLSIKFNGISAMAEQGRNAAAVIQAGEAVDHALSWLKEKITPDNEDARQTHEWLSFAAHTENKDLNIAISTNLLLQIFRLKRAFAGESLPPSSQAVVPPPGAELFPVMFSRKVPATLTA